MAKHDQRILKFLNQNADRAPTITEMMTRLNISISDISDSLGSLQAQGLISKKTNPQGIECWFPGAPQAIAPAPGLQVASQNVFPQAPPTGNPGNPMARFPAASEVHHPVEARTGLDPRPVNGPSDLDMPVPRAQPSYPKQAPVEVQHIQAADSFQAGEPIGETVLSQSSGPSVGSLPMYGLSQPAPKGVGVLTLVLGLAVAVGLSTWLGGRMAAKEVQKASKNFVERKSLTEATAGFAEFQDKTKAHITALEAEVKKLTEDLASSKAAAESLKTVASAKPEEAKGKAGKKLLPSAKSKALAKAAARNAAKKRKSQVSRSSGRDNSEYSSSSESGSSESSAGAPGVPAPPGLDDLPSPPSD